MAAIIGFTQAISRGMTAVQQTYRKQVRAIEQRADRRRAAAKTYYEVERVKAETELAKESARLRMYQAKAAVVRERQKVAVARHEAGEYTFGEQLMGAAKGVGRDLGRAYKEISKPPRSAQRRRVRR